MKNITFLCVFKVRTVISDFAVVLAIGLMVGVDAIIGLATPKLDVPTNFQVYWGLKIAETLDFNRNLLCFVIVLP